LPAWALLGERGTPDGESGSPVEQTQRWCAAALLLIEPRLRKVKGYRHLPRLVEALCRANTTQVDVA